MLAQDPSNGARGDATVPARRAAADGPMVRWGGDCQRRDVGAREQPLRGSCRSVRPGDTRSHPAAHRGRASTPSPRRGPSTPTTSPPVNGGHSSRRPPSTPGSGASWPSACRPGGRAPSTSTPGCPPSQWESVDTSASRFADSADGRGAGSRAGVVPKVQAGRGAGGDLLHS